MIPLAWKSFYPLCLILITIPHLVSSFAIKNEKLQNAATITTLENKSISLFPPTASRIFESYEERLTMTNVPIHVCDSSQQRKYADLTAANLSPPCEQAYQNYCGIRRKQNYTLITEFLPKVSTKSLSVQVTSIDPTFGWETQLWPEFSVCSAEYNITCPQNPNNLVQAFLHDSVPEGFPSMRALVRIRLFGKDENNIKRVYICRQIKLHVY